MDINTTVTDYQLLTGSLGIGAGTIQFSSPVDFNTLPVDCRNFLALTAAKLSCVCVVAQKQCEQILTTIRRELYAFKKEACNISYPIFYLKRHFLCSA